MGYSSRYHAASLAAVFLALAVGILIGVGFGDDVVSGTQQNLERSLKGDLRDARESVDELRGDLRQERMFNRLVFPALVAGKLEERRIGIIAIGGLPERVARDARTALERSGARLVSVSVVRAPPDLGSLSEALEETRFADVASDRQTLSKLGERIGRELVEGGRLVRRLKNRLTKRTSGSGGVLEGVIIVRERPEGLEGKDKNAQDTFERAVLRGMGDTVAPVVAIERTDAERSSVGFFDARGVTTVDNVDAVAGQVALVFALLGAEGSFGVKDSASRMLPELLTPAGSGSRD